MLALKCDVCGTYYTEPTPIYIWEDKKTSAETHTQVYLARVNGRVTVDLCETCAKELEAWLNSKGETK